MAGAAAVAAFFGLLPPVTAETAAAPVTPLSLVTPLSFFWSRREVALLPAFSGPSWASSGGLADAAWPGVLPAEEPLPDLDFFPIEEGDFLLAPSISVRKKEGGKRNTWVPRSLVRFEIAENIQI